MPNLKRLHKSICVPFCEDEYTTILADRQAFRAYLQQTYNNYPELFPNHWILRIRQQGQCLNLP